MKKNICYFISILNLELIRVMDKDLQDNFPNFNVYWQYMCNTLRKPADAVAIFFHWCITRQNFDYESEVR